MVKKFQWDANTKEQDMPKWLSQLIPATANMDGLDETNQFDHIRYRVQHEIDIYEEEGPEESGMSRKEYRDALKFMEATKPEEPEEDPGHGPR